MRGTNSSSEGGGNAPKNLSAQNCKIWEEETK